MNYNDMVEYLRWEESFYTAGYESTQKELEKLRAENAKLKECAKFYADQSNWQKNFGSPLESNARKIKNDDLWMDESRTPTGGKLARQVLKELGEE